MSSAPVVGPRSRPPGGEHGTTGGPARTPRAIPRKRPPEPPRTPDRQRQSHGVIFLAVAFGIALRRVAKKPITLRNIADVVDLGLQTLVTILHWVIDVVPLAVFGLVASIVGTQGFGAFHALGVFVLAVLARPAAPSRLLPHPHPPRLVGAARSTCCAACAMRW